MSRLGKPSPPTSEPPNHKQLRDILYAIAHGREPSGLSLERLTNRVPVRWEEQRVRLELVGR